MGPLRDNPEPDPLALLHLDLDLDNRVCTIRSLLFQLKEFNRFGIGNKTGMLVLFLPFFEEQILNWFANNVTPKINFILLKVLIFSKSEVIQLN